MGNYGTKIAKAGYDYDDGDRRLIYNSAYPLLKIAFSGSGTLTLSSDAGSKTIVTHNLGYLPFFYVWITYLDTATGSEVTKLRMCSWSEYLGVQVNAEYKAWATTTTIELDVYTGGYLYGASGNEVLDYEYVVFYDPLA